MAEESEIIYDNWNDLVCYCRNNFPTVLPGKGTDWIFRGEHKVFPALTTSLERETKKSFGTLDRMPELEQRLLREFKRKLHHYARDIPDDNDTLEWLALMRHYMAPVRLLDWNYSFFVALFFAIENAEWDDELSENDNVCIVHALKQDAFDGFNMLTPWEKIKIRQRINKLKKCTLANKNEEYLNRRALFDHLQNNPKLLIHPVNPFRLNERLSIQQGLFMVPGDTRKGFEDNLKAHTDYEENHKQIKISSSLTVRRNFLRELNRMNINRVTLFPDIQGFAESLKTFLAIQWFKNETTI